MSLITPDGGLIFWMVVIFAIVLFILAKWGFPAITSAVEGRSKRIEESLKKADEVDRREAGIAVEHEKMLAQALQEQGQILKDASATREQILAQAKAEASEETAKMIAQAKTQIEADRKTALADMRRQVAILSVEVAEKIIRKELSGAPEQSALIDRLVQEASQLEKPLN